MHRSSETFAAELRRLREDRSLTQEELAERAGLTVKAIGALERGERTRPYPHTVRALAEALALGVDARARLVALVPSRGARMAAGPVAVALPSAPLFGRQAEIEQVTDLLRTGRARLLTLTGPGGVGKTRMALEVLASESHRYDGGSAFVDLADVREPAVVHARIAAALGVPESVGLVPALAGRPLLVVLDNLEQVLGAAHDIADLVARCPDLTVVVTSRAALKVRAEHEVVLPPLAAESARELFRDRAAASGSPLPADDSTAGVVAELCARMDGLPLALELAAAGTRLLTPAALLARLSHRDLAGPRDLTERQRTMTATLDWSLDLLQTEQVRLFDLLAVFSGGFTLDAAEAVTDRDLLDDLGALVEQSLVLRASSPDDQPRFRILEPIRQYAERRLAGTKEEGSVRDRHARWYRDLALSSAPLLRAGPLGREVERLQADHANLRAAHTWLLEADRVADAADLASSLWIYLALRGHAREGLAWLENLGAGAPDEVRCRAAAARIGLRFAIWDVPGMWAEADGAVRLARRVGDSDLAQETLMLAGYAHAFAGEADAARGLLGEALAGPSEWARLHAQIALGQLLLVLGDLDEAGRVMDGALTGARELGNEFTVATALNCQATLTAAQGDDLATVDLLEESVAISVELGLSWTLSYSLPALAGVAVRLGEIDAAAYLFGASASLSATQAIDPGFEPAREAADDALARARHQLGDAAFREAWDRGRTASPGEVAELAKELTRLAHA